MIGDLISRDALLKLLSGHKIVEVAPEYADIKFDVMRIVDKILGKNQGVHCRGAGR